MQTDADRLRQVIAATGLSDRRFAVQVLLRDERTVRRWLGGDDIPAVVGEQLRERPLGIWRQLARITCEDRPKGISMR